MQNSLLTVLGQDASGNIIGSICFDNNLAVKVEVGQDWSGRDLLGWVPHKWDVLALFLLGKGRERGHDVGVSSDKAQVKVREAEKRLDIFEVLVGGPVDNCGDLTGVHFEPITCDKAQVLDVFLVKPAFFRFQVQAGFG